MDELKWLVVIVMFWVCLIGLAIIIRFEDNDDA